MLFLFRSHPLISLPRLFRYLFCIWSIVQQTFMLTADIIQCVSHTHRILRLLNANAYNFSTIQTLCACACAFGVWAVFVLMLLPLSLLCLCACIIISTMFRNGKPWPNDNADNQISFPDKLISWPQSKYLSSSNWEMWSTYKYVDRKHNATKHTHTQYRCTLVGDIFHAHRLVWYETSIRYRWE